MYWNVYHSVKLTWPLKNGTVGRRSFPFLLSRPMLFWAMFSFREWLENLANSLMPFDWQICGNMRKLSRNGRSFAQVSQVYVRAYNKKAAAIEQAGHWRAWGVWMEDMDQRATKLLYMRYTEIFDNVMVYVMESWVYWTRILASTCLIMMWRHRDAISCNRLMLQWQKIQYSTT